MTLTEAISRMHAAGLDARYDDVLLACDADAKDAQILAGVDHFDYKLQRWFDGSDHAHMISNDDTAPLLFCGADVVTCTHGAIARVAKR